MEGIDDGRIGDSLCTKCSFEYDAGTNRSGAGKKTERLLHLCRYFRRHRDQPNEASGELTASAQIRQIVVVDINQSCGYDSYLAAAASAGF